MRKRRRSTHPRLVLWSFKALRQSLTRFVLMRLPGVRLLAANQSTTHVLGNDERQVKAYATYLRTPPFEAIVNSAIWAGGIPGVPCRVIHAQDKLERIKGSESGCSTRMLTSNLLHPVAFKFCALQNLSSRFVPISLGLRRQCHVHREQASIQLPRTILQQHISTRESRTKAGVRHQKHLSMARL